jgi:hypothetical protein
MKTLEDRNVWGENLRHLTEEQVQKFIQDNLDKVKNIVPLTQREDNI